MKNFVNAIEEVINQGGELVISRSSNCESSMETIVPISVDLEEDDSVYLVSTNGEYRFYMGAINYDELNDEYYFLFGDTEITIGAA